MCLLAAEWRGEVQDHLRLHQYPHAAIVVLVVTIIIWIHFVVAIFSSHMYARQVFLLDSFGLSHTDTDTHTHTHKHTNTHTHKLCVQMFVLNCIT